MVWGAVAGAAVSAYGAYKGNQAQQGAQADMAEALEAAKKRIRRGRKKQQRHQKKGLSSLKDARGNIQAGYTDALAETSNFGQAERIRIADQQRGRYNDIAAQLGPLMNNTASVGVNRAINEDADRQLLDVGEAVSSTRSGMHIGRGQDVAASNRAIAAQHNIRGQSLSDSYNREADILLGQSRTFDTSYYDQLGSAAANIGSWFDEWQTNRRSARGGLAAAKMGASVAQSIVFGLGGGT
jgi:hypothetical protein